MLLRLFLPDHLHHVLVVVAFHLINYGIHLTAVQLHQPKYLIHQLHILLDLFKILAMSLDNQQ